MRLLQVRIKQTLLYTLYRFLQSLPCKNRQALHLKKMQITSYTIELQNIHLYARHGVMAQEKAVGGWFTIDIKLHLNDHGCAVSDDIENAVSYADVYDLVKKEMDTPSRLLENVCHRIIGTLLNRFAAIEGVEISLRKDTPPMGGDRLSAAVTMQARR